VRAAVSLLAATLVFAAGCAPGGVREADRLASAVEQRAGLSSVQQWAVSMLNTRTHGRSVTVGASRSKYALPGDLEVAPSAVPSALQGIPVQGLAGGQLESVSLLGGANGRPEAVMLDWGLKGLYVGPPGYRSPRPEWYVHELRPGIYVFFREK